MFDSYTISKGNAIPAYVNLDGAIAITRDTNHKGKLHKLFYFFQKIFYAVHSRKECDENLCHGMIFLRKGFKDQTVLIAHSVFKGILTSDRNYLTQDDVTELVIFSPQDEKVRKLLVQFAKQTSKNPRKPEEWKNHMTFSIKDLILALFHWKIGPSRRKMMHTALATADLLQGNFMNTPRNGPKGYFCTPYAMTLLQSASIVSQMDAQEEQQLKSLPRQKAAKRLYKWMNNPRHHLGKEFQQNKLWQFDARYGFSGQAAALLKSLSGNR